MFLNVIYVVHVQHVLNGIHAVHVVGVEERLQALCFDKSNEEDPTERLDGIHALAQGFHREKVTKSLKKVHKKVLKKVNSLKKVLKEVKCY